MAPGRFLAALFAVLPACGCFTITYRGNRDYIGVERSEWGHYFLWGLVGEMVVDL